MKFHCLTTQLQPALRAATQVAGNAVAPNTMIRLTAPDRGQHVVIAAAADDTVAYEAHIPAMVEESGEIFLNHRSMLVNEYIASLGADERMTIACDPEAEHPRTTLDFPGSHSVLRTYQPEQTPALPQAADVSDQARSFVCDTPELLQAFRRTAYAQAKNDSRPILSGVNFQVRPDGAAEMAASDGFRLSVQSLSVEGAAPEETIQAVIPNPVIRVVMPLLNGGAKEAPTTITLDPAGYSFIRKDQQQVAFRSPQGAFPNYQSLIPQEFKGSFQVPVSDLTRAAKAAKALFGDAESGSGTALHALLEMDYRPSGDPEQPQDCPYPHLVCRSGPNATNEYRSTVQVIDGGPELLPSPVTLQSPFVLDFLSQVNGDTVMVRLQDGQRPALLQAVPESAGYINVVMPTVTSNSRTAPPPEAAAAEPEPTMPEPAENAVDTPVTATTAEPTAATAEPETAGVPEDPAKAEAAISRYHIAKVDQDTHLVTVENAPVAMICRSQPTPEDPKPARWNVTYRNNADRPADAPSPDRCDLPFSEARQAVKAYLHSAEGQAMIEREVRFYHQLQANAEPAVVRAD